MDNNSSYKETWPSVHKTSDIPKTPNLSFESKDAVGSVVAADETTSLPAPPAYLGCFLGVVHSARFETNERHFGVSDSLPAEK